MHVACSGKLFGVDEQQVAEERHASELKSKCISPSFWPHSVRPVVGGQSVIPALAVVALITAEERVEPCAQTAGVPQARLDCS